MLDGLDNASIEMEEAKVCSVYVDLCVLVVRYRHYSNDENLKICSTSKTNFPKGLSC